MLKNSTPQRQAGGGGSAILTAWKAGREAERAVQARGGHWGPGPAQARVLRAPPNGALSRFMAASNDRLVADMVDTLGLVSGNAEVRMALRSMRARSRKLARDNEYVKFFLHLLRNNVPGAKGFSFQSKIYKQRKASLDDDANNTIEDGYSIFSKLGSFTACGQMSRRTFERTAITCLGRDGEVLVEKLIGRRYGRFGIAYQIVDPDLLDDQLNVGYGGSMPGYGSLELGNSIRMGVEINDAGRPVGYWFHSHHPGDDVAAMGVRRHRRVDAERIRHWFLRDDSRPGTTRGVPPIYAGIRRMAMTAGYEEAAIVSARQGASKMGFYKQPADENGGPVDGSKVSDGGGDDDPNEPDLYQEAEPGVFGVLPPGWDFQTYDPTYPHEGFAPFLKAMLRAFGSGVGLTYNVLANDYEGVNLSSIRHGALQDRDTYESLQLAMIEELCEWMFAGWLEMGLTMAQIGRLPLDAFDRLNKPKFFARPWRSPDPQKDVAAGAQKVALATTSRTRLCAEDGEDFEEIIEELAFEEALARRKGVTLDTAKAQASKNPPKTPPGPEPSGDDTNPDDEGEGDAAGSSAD